MSGTLPVSLLPEGDEAKDLFGLLAFAQIRVGVAEGMSLGVLRRKARMLFWLRERIET